MKGRFQAAPTKSFLTSLGNLPIHVRNKVETAIEEMVSNAYGGVRLKGKLEGLL